MALAEFWVSKYLLNLIRKENCWWERGLKCIHVLSSAFSILTFFKQVRAPSMLGDQQFYNYQEIFQTYIVICTVCAFKSVNIEIVTV